MTINKPILETIELFPRYPGTNGIDTIYSTYPCCPFSSEDGGTTKKLMVLP